MIYENLNKPWQLYLGTPPPPPLNLIESERLGLVTLHNVPFYFIFYNVIVGAPPPPQ